MQNVNAICLRMSVRLTAPRFVILSKRQRTKNLAF
jgi:hypothetical protein